MTFDFWNHGLHGLAALTLACFGMAWAAFAAEPTILVEARQRYPWNGLVDLHFTITGTSGTRYDTSFTAKDMVGGTNITMATIRKSNGVVANASKEPLLPGNYNWVWDAAADLPKNWQCDRVTVTGTANEFKPLYMVIDLSGGANASSYPVSYLDAVPDGGWTDEYKTTKLVLRRIDPGTFKMCGQYNVTLTRPFYIGVFEVTQKQYELLTGANPSYWGKGDKRPVACLSYYGLRGDSEGQGWPASSAVDSTSVLGKLRSRTGLDFDLPTEAQWEYACRAGTTSTYNNGGDAEDDLKVVGRYVKNASDGKGGYSSSYTAVGSYLPNAWGLYDMHGNAYEWCLDRCTQALNGLEDDMIDPKGIETDESSIIADRGRIVRGGSFHSDAAACASGQRRWDTENGTNSYYDYGFRLCLPL